MYKGWVRTKVATGRRTGDGKTDAQRRGDAKGGEEKRGGGLQIIRTTSLFMVKASSQRTGGENKTVTSRKTVWNQGQGRGSDRWADLWSLRGGGKEASGQKENHLK